MNYILVIVWFFVLIKSASYLVDWSINVAKKYRISNLVIWLTIVAFWTSAPEIFINLLSAINWSTDLALWNIVWSNIANILLILWVSAIIYPLKAQNSTVFREAPFSLLVSLALFFLIDDILFSSQIKNILTLWDSLILILFFIIFSVYTYWIMENVEEVQEEETHKLSFNKSVLYVIWWMIWLALWAEVIVRSAREIALSFWVSETIIWLTIVAFWTSLPELAASITASLKKDSDIVIWNIIWSNIINIVLWLSLTGLVMPIWLEKKDMVFVFTELWVTILLMVFLYFWSEKWKLNRWHWIVFIIIYLLYLGFISLRVIS